MATMFPEIITAKQCEVRPRLRVEISLYDELATQLTDDDWVVFYHAAWTCVEPSNKRVRAREVDFLIAHPSFGLLVVDVKSSRIEMHDSRWFAIGASDTKFEIQNPYCRVATATSLLERAL